MFSSVVLLLLYWEHFFSYHVILFVIADTTVQRYDKLQGDIAKRLSDLQQALAQTASVQENLDMLLKWLDEAEKNVHKMEKGTLIAVQREPLVENMQEQRVCRRGEGDEKGGDEKWTDLSFKS